MTRSYLGLHCDDCGLGTLTLGEYYTVNEKVWESAWAGRRQQWHSDGREILCIGCLEQRIGRTLTQCDFIDAPINDQNDPSISERMRNRLTADASVVLEGAA